MKKINISKRWLASLLSAGFVAIMLSFTVSDDWVAPAEYQKKANPVAADDESIEIGEVLYSKHCKSCHGKYGEGDGPKAAELDTDCGDFTMDEFQSQSDGSLFYKVKIGKDEMPGFEKKLPDDEDIWHLVNYMRTMQ